MCSCKFWCECRDVSAHLFEVFECHSMCCFRACLNKSLSFCSCRGFQEADLWNVKQKALAHPFVSVYRIEGICTAGCMMCSRVPFTWVHAQSVRLFQFSLNHVKLLVNVACVKQFYLQVLSGGFSCDWCPAAIRASWRLVISFCCAIL